MVMVSGLTFMISHETSAGESASSAATWRVVAPPANRPINTSSTPLETAHYSWITSTSYDWSQLAEVTTGSVIQGELRPTPDSPENGVPLIPTKFFTSGQ